MLPSPILLYFKLSQALRLRCQRVAIRWNSLRMRARILNAGGTVGDNFRVLPGGHWSLPRNAKISIGNNVTIAEDVHVYFHEGAELRIEDGSFVGRHSVLAARESLHIGKRVQIAHFVTLIDSDHDYSSLDRVHSAKTTPISVGDDTIIGAQAVVLRGVRIGKGAMIGAGSVVTKNIDDHAIAYGVPCRMSEKKAV